MFASLDCRLLGLLPLAFLLPGPALNPESAKPEPPDPPTPDPPLLF